MRSEKPWATSAVSVDLSSLLRALISWGRRVKGGWMDGWMDGK